MKNEIICRCEEITIEEVERAILEGATTVNEIKRWTRAGMGLCQGRTCRRLIERLLAERMNIHPAEVKPSTYRQPVRPIKMELLCNEIKTIE
ncbi:(2Fe-2S)-binding protein [Geosporobacter ferrireducens]|uniref:(2Fe-2S)-binding protein n=1 Tax=Geosporobacter ferrireducens TaxID=1424294 RepID=A0A1D8GP39_9FIRM|nr:(2Fe-2S)-binding protein [Geosporobacter ferrireducens]AOT72648.1 (2Fe-2S)-binding protein [Geosporobacter ferrireducens]MTI55052.1 (2Fe-2S)-binding protein [Geosporobacter ferrireducens]